MDASRSLTCQAVSGGSVGPMRVDEWATVGVTEVVHRGRCTERGTLQKVVNVLHIQTGEFPIDGHRRSGVGIRIVIRGARHAVV